MHRLFLFNPENDIALGNNLRQFTPPRQAALLHKAGAAIPFWLGNVGDRFLVGKEEMTGTLQWLEALEIDGPSPIERAESDEVIIPTPWGWSRDAISQFVKAGVSMGTLDGISGKIERHRELSHRRSSLKLLQLLRAKGIDVPDALPVEATTLSDVERYINGHGRVFLKFPWSSSGRGVFPADASSLARLSPAVSGILRTQGAVMAEVALDKVCDFAMLFLMEDGSAKFHGLSLFANSTSVNYGGNFVGSDDEILSFLSKYVPIQDISRLRFTLGECLEQLLGRDYEGPLGVDMLLYRDVTGNMRIDPVVEINLRYTMGFVARGVFYRLNETGWMRMTPGRIRPEGAMPLIPENPYFALYFQRHQ